MASEYATLKFLEKMKIPAPRAYGIGLMSNTTNMVGVNFLLIEALPGTPFRTFSATENQRCRVIKQVAELFAEIKRHPFLKAGSLFIRNDEPEIGPVASNRFVALSPLRPFDNAVLHFSSIADQCLDLIADGQLYHGCPIKAFVF